VPTSLTYSGYCLSERRYVPDKEKIDTAMVWIFQHQKRLQFKQTADGKAEAWYLNLIPYESIDEFRRANPNCCSIGARPGDDYTEPTFVRRLFGLVSEIIVIDYLERYIDDQGNQRTQRVTRQVSVDVCGHHVN